MGDMGDDFRAVKAFRKAIRARYGVDCMLCKAARPKGTPSLLLPQQVCKVDRYRDPRPLLTDAQRQAAVDDEDRASRRTADRIDGYDRDDLGESPDF